MTKPGTSDVYCGQHDRSVIRCGSILRIVHGERQVVKEYVGRNINVFQAWSEEFFGGAVATVMNEKLRKTEEVRICHFQFGVSTHNVLQPFLALLVFLITKIHFRLKETIVECKSRHKKLWNSSFGE